MDAGSALRAIRKGWFLVVLGFLSATAAAVALHMTADPFYEATATYVVTPIQDPADPAAVQESIRTLDDARSRAIVATFAEILESGAILTEAARTAGFEDGAAAAYEVDAVILPEANVIDLTIRGPEPAGAALLSSAVGGLGADRFTELYQIYDVVLLDAPSAPTSPANATLLQTLVMAGALGLLAGAALALSWGAPRVRREQRRERRLLSYSVSEEPGVVTPLRHREDRRAAGSG